MPVNMPYRQERAASAANAPSPNAGKLWSPLPAKPKEKHSNPVLIPIVYPAKWRMFNPTAAEAQKFNMASEGGTLVSVPADLSSFYFKIPVHGVPNYTRNDGTVGFTNVICPVQLNKYLTDVLGFAPLFNTPRCAFCEEEQRWWNTFNARFEELGYTQETRKSLSRDDYRRLADSDPVLKNSRLQARKFQHQSKYVMPIIDYAQLTGEKPLLEGQTQVEHQIWFSPQSVFETLADMCDIAVPNMEFYSMDSSTGVQVLHIVKDTTKCSPGNMLPTTYSVMAGARAQLDPQWIDYIMNTDLMVDPSDLLSLSTYEEQMYYLSSSSQEQTGSSPAQKAPVARPAPAQAPVQPTTPPVATPAPAPMPAPVAQAAPVPQRAPAAPMPAPVPSPVPTQAPATPKASPIPVVQQAQPGAPNRTPPKGPPPGRKAW